jgi:tRNA modification GTPase
MYSLDDTIAAISTAPGEGGIGILRMTGPDAANILIHLFVPGSRAHSDSHGGQEPILQPRTLHYGHIADPGTSKEIDEVLAVYMPAPRTYTRQDVVEIQGHGGFVALQRIQALCLQRGARLAEPGEFTARAFLNGRLDLAQAEAVLDVVQARTDVALQAAVGQLGGLLSDQVRSVRRVLVDVLAYLEATIDFVEDEIPEQDIGPMLGDASARLQRLVTEADRGIIYRQGVRTAIVGRPNVGKSSLLNRLLRTSRAIVTDIPGTTRDTLEETLNLQGIPIVLVDTAGIMAGTEDPIERLGIERSRAALAQADLALWVVDASRPLTDADLDIGALLGPRPVIAVLNKIDLVETGHCHGTDAVDIAESVGRGAQSQGGALTCRSVAISARTGEGLDKLEAAIVETVLTGRTSVGQTPLVTSPRHRQALERALEHVDAAGAGYGAGQLPDMLAIDVTAAVTALGEITGQTASDDLLETIFGSFCIGK